MKKRYILCLICAIICLVSVGICLGNIITYKSLFPVSDLNYKWNDHFISVITFWVYFFTALFTLCSVISAFIVPGFARKEEKNDSLAKIECFIENERPYFNRTISDFYEFSKDNQLIYDNNGSPIITIGDCFFYRFKISVKSNTAKNVTVFLKELYKNINGKKTSLDNFLPMNLVWSYKDLISDSKYRVCADYIYKDTDKYCDFCMVKKNLSTTPKDAYLVIRGEYIGLSNDTICNCIFENGFYEAVIVISADNCESITKTINFAFNSCPSVDEDGIPHMIIFQK